MGELTREFPQFSIRLKSGDWLSSVLDRFLKLVTWGGQSGYLTKYHTVLGYTLYVSTSWDKMNADEKYVLLRHERVHLRQRRRLTFPLMAFIYIFPLFPLGLAYGRARLEWEAYKETLAATVEVFGVSAVEDDALRSQIVERFVSADYGWMWPFPQTVEGWYNREIARLGATVYKSHIK